MDLVTQGVVGAALPLATRKHSQIVLASGIGFVAGLAPDLDVFIQDPDDTLHFLEFHRHFTHSLIFIPIGGAIVAATFWILLRRRLAAGYLQVWLFSSLGFATHGLLDAATSFGTLLLWPFDNSRYSLSIISIVDPFFSIPIIILVGVGVIRRDGRWGRIALFWATTYLLAGAWQHQLAMRAAQELADQREHRPTRVTVKPTFGNIILWRSIYEADGHFYIDAIRPGPWKTKIKGTSVAKLDSARDFPWLNPRTTQAEDIKRFRQLSQDYVAKARDGTERIIDVRYAVIPTQISGLWSIRLRRDARPHEHAVYETDRSKTREQLPSLVRMIFGKAR